MRPDSSNGATYEIWADGEKVASQDTGASHFMTEISIPAGRVMLEGKVKYKNRYGTVIFETSTFDTVPPGDNLDMIYLNLHGAGWQ